MTTRLSIWTAIKDTSFVTKLRNEICHAYETQDIHMIKYLSGDVCYS